MAKSKRDPIVDRLLDAHGETFAEELGIDVAKNTPSPLFRLLCFALLASTRIGHEIALDAAKALSKAGWRSAKSMAEATWKERVVVLNRSGYARYDESTSRYLEATSKLLLDKYGGDLRKLREEAGGDAARMRELVKDCKGIGDVGCDIFFREAQLAWDELYPFADDRTLAIAAKLGLPDDAESLAKLTRSKRGFTRLVAALMRAKLTDDLASFRER
jgi:hypothetical protein